MTTTPAMTGKDRAMPNNSDQAALHDELRARHVAVLRRLLDGDTAARAEKNPVLLSDEREAVEYFAALTLPASEAVAMWPISEEQYQEALTAYEDAYEITDSHCNGIAAVIKTLLKWRDDPATTPPPAPAAHAGGEAAPYGWLEPSTGNFVDHATKLEMPFDASTYTLAVYTHPSPMPVDALRELIDVAVKAGRELDEYGALTSAQAVMDAVKKARSLLSGGAAREGK